MWSIGEILTAIGLVMTLLTLLGGGLWWMSALYWSVNGIRKDLANISGKFDAVVAEVRVDRAELWKAIRDVETRVTIIEAQRE